MAGALTTHFSFSIMETYLKTILRQYKRIIAVTLACTLPAAAQIMVSVDRSTEYLVSEFEVGVTFTQNYWEYGNSTAVTRAKQLLVDGRIRYNNVHIMGWGTGNPEPNPGTYNFDNLDFRINLIATMEHALPVITFCTAPGWMKTSGEDWNMEDRVATEHFGNFAGLCKKIAQRYSNVTYFQVWNELKGFWNEPDDYITMYNMVYDSVKHARPDAIIGGPYTAGCDLEVIGDWLSRKHGGDFVCWDGWVQGWPPENHTDEAWQMARTGFFGNDARRVRAITDLPMWISEYYAGGAEGTSTNQDFIAANNASCYYYSLLSKTSLGMLWGHTTYLFSSTDLPGGGQPTALYQTVKYFNVFFGPGTRLYATTCSDTANLNVLASADKTLLINKQPLQTSVDVDGENCVLGAYDVRLIDAPSTATHARQTAAALSVNRPGRRIIIDGSFIASAQKITEFRDIFYTLKGERLKANALRGRHMVGAYISHFEEIPF